jgi:hypothetical protein
LAEKLADRAKAKGLAGRTVTLKLKRNDFRTLTRRITLPDGTQTADRIYRTARALYDRMDHPEPYRLIGVGISDLMPKPEADREADLLDPRREDPPRRRGCHRQDPRPLRPRRDPQGSCAQVTRRPGPFIFPRNTAGGALGGQSPHRPRPVGAETGRTRRSRSAYSAASGIAPGVASMARAMTEVTIRRTLSKFPFGRIIRSFM